MDVQQTIKILEKLNWVKEISCITNETEVTIRDRGDQGFKVTIGPLFVVAKFRNYTINIPAAVWESVLQHLVETDLPVPWEAENAFEVFRDALEAVMSSLGYTELSPGQIGGIRAGTLPLLREVIRNGDLFLPPIPGGILTETTRGSICWRIGCWAYPILVDPDDEDTWVRKQ